MRNAALFTVVLLLLCGLGAFAWVSNNPESPHLETAQEWPVVGGLARMIREAYLGPQTASDAEESASTDPAETGPAGGDPAGDAEPFAARDLASGDSKIVRPAEEQESHEALLARLRERVVGGSATSAENETDETDESASSADSPDRPRPPIPPIPDAAPPTPTLRAPLPLVAQEWRWFLPGQPVLDDSRSQARVRLVSMAYLPVLSRDGGWLKVRYDGEDGWIDASWQPEHPRRDARRGILRGRAQPTMETDREDLAVGKELMGVRKPRGEIGSWKLFTDVEDEDLLQLVSAAAEHAEDAFFARYGRVPERSPTHAVLLFAEDADYREFADETAELPTVGHRGFAGVGLVAITTEGLGRREVASVLIHELTHLLVRRSLGLQLPPWLNEGMATDLGSVWVENSRDLVLDRLIDGDHQEWTFGAFQSRLAYLEFLSSAGRLPTIQSVLSRRQSSFYLGANVGTSYAQSAAFVRYALDGEDGQMAAGFLEFLDLAAEGKRADLLALLGQDLPRLEAGFRAWLTAEAQRSREGLIRRHDAGSPRR